MPIEQIVPKLAKIFTAFKAERTPAELFGDYCRRMGLDKLKELVGTSALRVIRSRWTTASSASSRSRVCQGASDVRF